MVGVPAVTAADRAVSLGVDVGSLTAKAVVVDAATGEVVGQALLPTGPDPQASGRAVREAALRAAGLPLALAPPSVGTGYGRISLDFVDRRLTEITCHARGIHQLLPATRLIIDIGGQDSKVIAVDEAGRPLDFEMNDRCAAGTGRFLEVMAGALGTDLTRLAEMALASPTPAQISSTCTVFAESEVVSLLAQGRDVASIAAGLCRAVAQRAAALTQRLGLETPVAFTGGVALNAAVRAALAAALGADLSVPPQPQLSGALGAALIARPGAMQTT